MKIRKLLMIVSGTLFLLGACHSKSPKNQETDFVIPDSLSSEAFTSLQDEAMEGIIENLASPVEVSMMLHNLNVPFLERLPANSKNAEDLNTSFQKALMLGILSADLGYLNIYEKNTPIIDYISAIKFLTDELKVGQFYNFNTLKSLSENKHDLDSLMFISVHSFNKMNSFLEKTKRGQISALVMTGLWVEGMYLATQVIKDYPHQEISESIGEQKLIIEDLFSVLNVYRSIPGFGLLVNELEQLKTLLNKVEITYETGEPETMEDENGMLVIVQNERSIVHITEKQLDQITSKTAEIRNRLLNFKSD